MSLRRSSIYFAIIAACLSACGSTSAVQTEQKAFIAFCGSYSTALNTLTAFNKQGKLSAKIVADVDSANQIAGPLCDPTKSLPTDIPTAITTLAPVVNTLVTDIAGVSS